LLALNADGVFALVEQASAFGSSGIFVAVVFGLYTRFGGAHSAVFALVSGTLVYVYGTWAEWETPYLASLATALAGYVLLALASPKARAEQ
jgi:SSS family solute:Na+ symporter